jgi:glycosyltransferase involved in cell wall biosynthesis
MKVLFVTDAPVAPPLAGDQLVTAQLLASLKERSDLAVLTLRPGRWDPAIVSGTRILNGGSLGAPAPAQRMARMRALVGTKSLLEQRLADLKVPRLEEILREESPKVVLFNHLRVAALLSRIAVPAGTRSVYVAHNAEHEAYASMVQIETNPFLRFALVRERQKTVRLERMVVQAADLTVALTEEDSSRLRALHPGAQVQVIPPAVAPHEHEMSAERGPCRVLLVGSYLWHAKFLNALWLVRDVWPTVLDRFPQAQLQIVGKGAGRLERHVANLGTVSVHADVPDIGTYLSRATIFVNPERQRGGIKLKTLDAASFGLPIVSTAAGVEGTGLENDASCIVANDSASFARGILRLIVDPKLGKDLGIAARRVMCSRFSAGGLDERIERMLERLGKPAHTVAGVAS